MRLQRRLCWSVCAVALGANGMAFAQDADEDSGKRLATVTVTAQKVEQNLQDVPISITAIDATRAQWTVTVATGPRREP